MYNTKSMKYGYKRPELESYEFRLSPSSLPIMNSKQWDWFKQNILEQDGFLGNTSSVTGSCVHELADRYVNNRKLVDDDYELVDQYAFEQAALIEELAYEEVIERIPPMIESLMNWIDKHPIDATEFFVKRKLTEHVVIQGKVDYTRTFRESDMDPDNLYEPAVDQIVVGDYKTTAAKTLPKGPSFDHLLQAYTYAYVLKEQGEDIGGVEITYVKSKSGGEISEKTGKQLKVYPAETKSYVRQYTAETHEFIYSFLSMIADKIEYFIKHPDLAYILFSSGEFKGMNFTEKVKRFKTTNLLEI